MAQLSIKINRLKKKTDRKEGRKVGEEKNKNKEETGGKETRRDEGQRTVTKKEKRNHRARGGREGGKKEPYYKISSTESESLTVVSSSCST